MQRILGWSEEVQKLFSLLVHTREGGTRVRWADLDVRRVLGVGTFGRVKLTVRATGDGLKLFGPSRDEMR